MAEAAVAEVGGGVQIQEILVIQETLEILQALLPTTVCLFLAGQITQ